MQQLLNSAKKPFYHGTPNPLVGLSTDKHNVIYLIDDISMARYFAGCEGRGGLFKGEEATIIHFYINASNPFIIDEDAWEDIADSCNINKDDLIKKGYDCVWCKNSSNCTYVAVLDEQIIKEIKREKI